MTVLQAKYIAQKISQEIPHELAIIVCCSENRMVWNIAVVGASGKLLVHDFGHLVEFDPIPFCLPMKNLNWEQWEGRVRNLLEQQNRPWVKGPLAKVLSPDFSLCKWACLLLSAHWGHARYNHSIVAADVLAYLPIEDCNGLLSQLRPFSIHTTSYVDRSVEYFSITQRVQNIALDVPSATQEGKYILVQHKADASTCIL